MIVLSENLDSKKVYPAGILKFPLLDANSTRRRIQVYCDPNMKWNNCKIFIGKKSTEV